MKIDILTLFPEMFEGVLSVGVIGRAAERGLLEFNIIDIRDHTEDKHRKADDYPFGGGAGQLMTAQPIFSALRSLGINSAKGDGATLKGSASASQIGSAPASQVGGSVESHEGGTSASQIGGASASQVGGAVESHEDGASASQRGGSVESHEDGTSASKIGGTSASQIDSAPASQRGGSVVRRIYLSPRGRVLDKSFAEELANEPTLLLLCGHYEGVDQRALDAFGFEEVSIGDYILTGGELPSMVLIDAVCRLIPGVLGSEDSHAEESIYSGLLEYPQYTRPASFEGLDVPEILVSGDHLKIALWNFEQSLRLTAERRPDLLRAWLAEHYDGLDKHRKKIAAAYLEENPGF